MAMNPVMDLEGTELDGGWKVINRLPMRGERGAEGKTGGNFSVGYVVEKEGALAFMKVFDISRAFAEPPDRIAQELQKISSAFLHEKALLTLCKDAGLDRIVQVLADGTISGGGHPPIFYLIFERAENDIRSALGALGIVEDAWKFKQLHQVAIGLGQLHNQKVAHQDLKPSNVLLFAGNKGSKIADLGRASQLGKGADHDAFMVAGDPNYAPPEQLYGYHDPQWVNRREACDLYHLGALVCFLFSGVSPTVKIFDILGGHMIPAPLGPWRGSYQDALPFLQSAFTRFMVELEPTLPDWCRSELMELIRTACHPEVTKRGDPAARRMVGAPIGIDRYVSRLQMLHKRGQVAARIASARTAPESAA